MEFSEQLKSAVDIVQVIGEYVTLKRAGQTNFKGLCPFHNEKSPSFNVSTSGQFYKCFGCGAGGDVYKFVMEYEKVTFVEAMKMLAERYGIPMPQRPESNDPDAKLRAALLAMHQLAAKLYIHNLQGASGQEARAYLDRRQLPMDQAAAFGLGFSEKGTQLYRLLQKEGFAPAELEASGLVGRREDGSYYDKFRGRLMFPIHNESGKVIAFGGRALAAGEEPKYLNSPGTAIYHKSTVLYHLHRARETARKTGRMVLVEGYMDVIGAYSAGVHEVVAPCGTALTAQQVRAIRKYASKIIVNFDPDNAGANAAERSLAILLEENMRVHVATLDDGLDPDEFVLERGAEAYQQRIAQAPSYFYWLAGRARQRFDIRTAEGKVQALEFLLPSLRKVHDKVERATLASDLAQQLGVEQGLLLEEFRKSASNRAEMRSVPQVLELPPTERMLLQLALHSASVREFVWPILADPERPEHQRLRQGQGWGIWGRLLQVAPDQPVELAKLDELLSPLEKNLMASLVFADVPNEESNLVMQAGACLNELAAGDQRARVADLKRRIQEAEKRGDFAEALALMETLRPLEMRERG